LRERAGGIIKAATLLLSMSAMIFENKDIFGAFILDGRLI